jgi:hypothetical protein
VRAIAAELGRSPATVSRELRRNLDPGSAQYRPFTAQRLAARRRPRPGRGKLLHDPVLRQFVQQKLGKQWSPEQISAALRGEFPDDPAGTWCTRRSTRRSTDRSWVGCVVTCQGVAHRPSTPQATP